MMMTTTHLTVKRSGLISAPYVLLWELDTNFKVASNPCSFSYSFTSESSWCGNPELTCTGSASRTWDQPRVVAASTRAPDINKVVSNNHHPRTPHTLIVSSMATNQWIAFVTCESMIRSRSWWETLRKIPQGTVLFDWKQLFIRREIATHHIHIGGDHVQSNVENTFGTQKCWSRQVHIQFLASSSKHNDTLEWCWWQPLISEWHHSQVFHTP